MMKLIFYLLRRIIHGLNQIRNFIRDEYIQSTQFSDGRPKTVQSGRGTRWLPYGYNVVMTGSDVDALKGPRHLLLSGV